MTESVVISTKTRTVSVYDIRKAIDELCRACGLRDEGQEDGQAIVAFMSLFKAVERIIEENWDDN